MATTSLPTHPERHADAPDLPVLHVMCSAVVALGLWFPQCSCGWIGEGQTTYHRAISAVCGHEQAMLDGLRNRFHLHRAQREDAALNREFPRTVPQV